MVVQCGVHDEMQCKVECRNVRNDTSRRCAWFANGGAREAPLSVALENMIAAAHDPASVARLYILGRRKRRKRLQYDCHSFAQSIV